MKITVTALVLPLTAVLVYSPGCFGEAGEIYKWQDKRGVIRYSDQMPPPYAKNVQKYRKTANGLVLVKPEPPPPSEAVPPKSEPAPIETGSTAPDAPAAEEGIVLFSFEECGAPCKEAEEFLNRRGVPYTLRNKELDKLELQKRTGKLEAPVIYVGKKMHSGFQAGVWNELLEAAGYGKASSATPSGNPAQQSSRP
jgi:glutaredoxin